MVTCSITVLSSFGDRTSGFIEMFVGFLPNPSVISRMRTDFENFVAMVIRLSRLYHDN